ncbi:MAG TPA: hypothetical protein VF677_01870, partial [Flavobacterium sp.]
SDGGSITVFYYKKDDQKSGTTTKHEVSGYDTTIELELSKEQGYHHIQFYADDNDAFFDGGVSNVFCGAVSFYVTECFCDRDIAVEEMLQLIYHLRVKEDFITYKEKFLNMGDEYIPSIRISTGKISENLNQLKLLTSIHGF